jgi:hypothetical protein
MNDIKHVTNSEDCAKFINERYKEIINGGRLTSEEQRLLQEGDECICELVNKLLPRYYPLFDKYHELFDWMFSISETMESDKRAMPEGFSNLSTLQEMTIYMKGYQDAYHRYDPIVRNLLAELKTINISTNPVTPKAIKLRGKSKKIFEDPKERKRFINYYLKNSIKRTAKHFGISEGAVQNIAKNCGIKKPPIKKKTSH